MIKELDEAIRTTVYFSSPLDWERLLDELQKTLHKSDYLRLIGQRTLNPHHVVIPFSDHYLCLDVKRLLVQLYGWKEGFKLNEMSDEMLKRKIDLCENYVSVYSKVEPCPYTKWRGRILEEMVGPVAMLAKMIY